jgi:hypothetical protein
VRTFCIIMSSSFLSFFRITPGVSYKIIYKRRRITTPIASPIQSSPEKMLLLCRHLSCYSRDEHTLVDRQKPLIAKPFSLL